MRISNLPLEGNRAAFGEIIEALNSYRQAIKIREQLSARDPENAEARAELASSYAKLGQAYIALASNPRIRSANRAEKWREARAWLQRSLKIWTIMRDNGTLPGSDEYQPDGIATQIARCDSELKKFANKLPGPPKS